MRWTMALLVFTIPTLASAQESYTLKMPPQAKGDVQRVSIDMRDAMRVQRLDMFGNELKRHLSSSASQLNYADECLATENGLVTSFRRHFDNAVALVNDANLTVLAIQGKTVLVSQAGGARQIAWEGEAFPHDAFTEQLEQQLKDGKDKMGNIASFEPLPSQPVKAGESWAIDVSALVKDCEAKHGCKLTGATGTGTLKQVYQGPKGPCAKVEVHIKIPLKTIQTSGIAVELNDNCGTTLDGVYDFALIAGDSHYQSTVRLNFEAVGNAAEKDGTSSRLQIETAIELKEQRVAAR